MNDPNDRLLRAGEVAELLGVSPHTVLDWAEAGKLPSFKLGKAVRLRQSEILAWIENQRREAAA